MGANASNMRQRVETNISNTISNNISNEAVSETAANTSCENNVNITMRGVSFLDGCSQNIVQKCDVQANLETIATQMNNNDLSSKVSNSLANTLDSVVKQTVGLGIGGNLSNQDQETLSNLKTQISQGVSDSLRQAVNLSVAAAQNANIDMFDVVYSGCNSNKPSLGKSGSNKSTDSSFIDDHIDEEFSKQGPLVRYNLFAIAKKEMLKKDAASRLKNIDNIVSTGKADEDASEVIQKLSDGGQNIAQFSSVTSVSKNMLDQTNINKIVSDAQNTVENTLKAKATQSVDALSGLAFLAFLPFILLGGGGLVAFKMLKGKGSSGHSYTGASYASFLQKNASLLLIGLVISIVIIRKNA